MRDVYLINLSFGLAGTERRFANIWHALRQRGNVNPILVVPESLAEILYDAGLATEGDSQLWTVKEPSIFRPLARLASTHGAQVALAAVRSRIVAARYRWVWDRIRRDSAAVIHVGLNCSGLNPPDAPIVYECVDATLTQLGTRHFVKAARRPSIIHCQTDRIREALERGMADRKPRWTTVSSPCYFASYPDIDNGNVSRDSTLVAFVGRFAPEKNPLLYVDAIGRLVKSGVPCRGLMLGEGPMRDEIVARVDQLGLSNVIEVAFSQRPSDRLREVAVFVTLQGGDNYGSQSLLEAMGAGCAIIATDVGATRRLVNRDVGLLVSASVDDVVTALRELLADPSRTAALGAAAAQLARTRYTADIYCAFLESLYVAAVEKHDAAAARNTSHHAGAIAERLAAARHS